jgi:hypothetical protein
MTLLPPPLADTVLPDSLMASSPSRLLKRRDESALAASPSRAPKRDRNDKTVWSFSSAESEGAAIAVDRRPAAADEEEERNGGGRTASPSKSSGSVSASAASLAVFRFDVDADEALDVFLFSSREALAAALVVAAALSNGCTGSMTLSASTSSIDAKSTA